MGCPTGTAILAVLARYDLQVTLVKHSTVCRETQVRRFGVFDESAMGI